MAKLIPYLSFIAGILIAIIAVPSAITTLGIASETDAYVSTRAKLIQHRAESHGSGPDTQKVTFEYTVGDREYEGDNYWTKISDTEEDIKERIRKEKNGTKTILVYYHPEKPNLAIIHKEVDIRMPVGTIVLSVLLILGGAMSYASGRKRHKMINRNSSRRSRDKAD